MGAEPSPSRPAAADLPPEVSPELCELGALAGWLLSMTDSERLLLADHCPRPVPPKARRRRRDLWWVLLLRWARPDARAFFVAGLRYHQAEEIDRLRDGGAGAVAALEPEAAPVALLWAAVAAGLPLQEAWAALPAATREAVVQVVPALSEMRGQILAHHEQRAGWAEESRRRTVQAEVERLTRGLRVQSEQARVKSARAQQAAEVVIREHAAEVGALQAELDSARGRIADLEAELAAAREHQAEVGRAHARVVAGLAGRLRDAAAPPDRPLPLGGHFVLVVGDEGRQAEYRRIIESLGGEFRFLPGFGNPAHLASAAAGASLLVLVTAWASHKVFGQARIAEEAGVPLVLVPQAGAARFREAVERWLRRGAGG